MPKIKPITARQLIRKLRRVGFIETHQRGSHLYLFDEKTKAIVTVPIHGSKDIPVGTLYNIIVRQAGLSVEAFNKL